MQFFLLLLQLAGTAKSFEPLHRRGKNTLPYGIMVGSPSFVDRKSSIRASEVDASSIPDTSTPSGPKKVPSLIVFDLDNTLWTPELYTLRSLQRSGGTPVAGRDVKLFPGAREVLTSIREGGGPLADVRFAVASRTSSGEWARDLLRQFDIEGLFEQIEIFPGDKSRHFKNLQKATGVPYDEMLFFDDARDGRYGNCVPVSAMGVLCCHCPDGLVSSDVFGTALDRFSTWDKTAGCIVERDGSVTAARGGGKKGASGERTSGSVVRLMADRKFGFVPGAGKNRKDLFFHFNNLPDRGEAVAVGDRLSYVVSSNGGKSSATEIQYVAGPRGTTPEAPVDTVQMHVFSMNMPFAALLANEYKTLETRNGTMFTPYPPGTKFLLHVGKRTYPDGDRHIDVMKSDGALSDADIASLKSLPDGFGRGAAVAICEIGSTVATTLEDRCDPNFQRSVGAFGADSGYMATEIRRAEFLKRPVRVSGRGGVFKADVDRGVIPDGWLD